MESKLLSITGHVQGVFFRAEAKEKADELGVQGWIYNDLDGSVRVHVEGEDKPVEEFVRWCDLGPAGATIEAVEERETEAENLTSFEVRH